MGYKGVTLVLNRVNNLSPAAMERRRIPILEYVAQSIDGFKPL